MRQVHKSRHSRFYAAAFNKYDSLRASHFKGSNKRRHYKKSVAAMLAISIFIRKHAGKTYVYPHKYFLTHPQTLQTNNTFNFSKKYGYTNVLHVLKPIDFKEFLKCLKNRQKRKKTFIYKRLSQFCKTFFNELPTFVKNY